MRSFIFTVSALLSLSACATTPGVDEILGPPSVVAAPGEPAPPQARFYADCIAQAAQANSFDREGRGLRFHCTGAPAQAFYDGLASWTAVNEHSQIAAQGRTWRYTQPIRRDPSGLDYCSVSDGPTPDYACTIVLNVGAFITE